MTPEEMKALSQRLGWYAWRLGEAAKAVRRQADQTTWTGAARTRFDDSLHDQLSAARKTSEKLLDCAHELGKSASRLREVQAGLRADERDVRAAYPEYLRRKGQGQLAGAIAESRLPPPLDPRWSDLAREVLGRTHTKDLAR